MTITRLKGVGSSMAETLGKLDISTVVDLLFHLPIRYLDRTKITPVANLRTNTTVVIQGRVLKAQVLFGKRRSLAVTVEDDTGETCLRFYHFSAAQKNGFEQGRLVRCYGDPRLGSSGIEFYHPEYEFVDSMQDVSVDESLTPVYGLTDGISQNRMRKLAEQAVNLLKTTRPEEFLSESINARFGVESLGSALATLHFPPPETSVDAILEGQHPCQLRLAFEEMLAHFLIRQQFRARIQVHRGPKIHGNETKTKSLLDSLSFKMTSAQNRVCNEIRNDMKKGLPMLRMVQGDVGSGKTLVAALSALDVICDGYQVAVVAPTEILAEQHLKSFSAWLEPLDIKVVWLVGKLKASEKKRALEQIGSGEAKLIVGTHALFQEHVEFNCLGLSIIDEQHRFGVDQRLSLRKINRNNEIPHQLTMTATPIPRTLAMTAYSDMDYSVIDELPPGRTPIQTSLIPQKRRSEIVERIRFACREGAQAYWVCPLVEDSETLSAANAEESFQTLKASLEGITVGLVHGRQKASEKEAEMTCFKTGETQLLVATTVIEVGVDVPNASLMIIENPERLGLAQLHQLRGHVGRDSKASHCVLLYGAKLSQQAQERLQILRKTNDGFVIAEKDLELRGPGELLGTRQTGDLQFKLADTIKHAHLVPEVHEVGRQLFSQDENVCEKLISRWIGNNSRYAQA